MNCTGLKSRKIALLMLWFPLMVILLGVSFDWVSHKNAILGEGVILGILLAESMRNINNHHKEEK